MVTITIEFLESGMCKGIGIKRSQCKILNLEYPLKKGWKQSLVGKVLTDEQAAAFLKLRKGPCKITRRVQQKETQKPIKRIEESYIFTPFIPIHNLSFDDMRKINQDKI